MPEDRVPVATVLTVHGIETGNDLVFSVDKIIKLQQSLPFTVLKPTPYWLNNKSNWVATVLTVHGIETSCYPTWSLQTSCSSCNSPYRSRY